MPPRWSRADRDIAHPEVDRVFKRSAVGVLAQRDRRFGVTVVPVLKRHWQHTERD